MEARRGRLAGRQVLDDHRAVKPGAVAMRTAKVLDRLKAEQAKRSLTRVTFDL